MADQDPDEVQRRFAELIGAEFGSERAEKLDAPAPADRPSQPGGVRPGVGPTAQPSPGVEYLDLEFTDDEDYRTPSPIGAPRSRIGLIGAVLLGFGLLVALAGLFTSPLPAMLSWVAACCWVVGLSLLMSRALRRPDDDEGPQTRL